jgi:hypothetical protein
VVPSPEVSQPGSVPNASPAVELAYVPVHVPIVEPPVRELSPHQLKVQQGLMLAHKLNIPKASFISFVASQYPTIKRHTIEPDRLQQNCPIDLETFESGTR